ncbi:MAG: FtsW/RodA/SpoVE family cell cycle protein [Rickettsiales bacterium]|nr:FtsW/RodA/SpoVE family cell cycle protein [Rickettsiales bacterium]
MFSRDNLKFFQKSWLSLDKKLFFLFVLLLTLGCLFSFSMSIVVANLINLSRYYFFRRHLMFVAVSLVIAFFMSFMDTTVAKNSALLLFCVSMILLVLVQFIGFQTKGARRWLYIAGISLQPSEFIKPSLIILNAYLLDKFLKTRNFGNLLVSTAAYGGVALFILKQPDIGTFLLISLVFFTQIFLMDFFRLKYCLYVLLASVCLLILIYTSSSHVSERVDSFLAGFGNIEKANYQVKRSLMAYENANWLGRGFLEGEIKNHIPDVHTDFLFPAIAEEFGFLIAAVILFAYFYLSMRVLLAARQKNSNFEFLALNGLVLLVYIQTSINLCVSLNLAPTKGITLPLLSYGGSSMIGTAIIFGYIFVFLKKDFGFYTSKAKVIDIRNLDDEQ